MASENQRHFIGRFSDSDDTRGWFVGSFFKESDPRQTDKVEVQYKRQEKGHICKKHYHGKKIEIILVLRGKILITLCDKDQVEVSSGQFLLMRARTIMRGEFLEDTEYFTIHAPSIVNDKVALE